jgi:DnaA family protein
MMQKLFPQLTLGFHLNDRATFANFYVGKNTEVVLALKKIASGEGEHHIYLCAPCGQGCSHLLQACNHYAYQHQLSSVYLPLASLLTMSPDILLGLESLALVCLDDLQAIAGHAAWEEAIFHLYNRVNSANGRIVMAAHALPKAINIELPDLVSRLSWGGVYQLELLTDNEKLTILTLRAKQRGIHLSEEVACYMLTHCPRHMGTLCAALDALDKASLAAQRRLTVPFVKKILEIA